MLAQSAVRPRRRAYPRRHTWSFGGRQESEGRRVSSVDRAAGRAAELPRHPTRTGHAGVMIRAAILGLSGVGKNPRVGAYHLLPEPLVALPSCLGIQREPDTRFKEVIDAWLDMARGSGQIREWMLEGLAKNNVSLDQVPSALT